MRTKTVAWRRKVERELERVNREIEALKKEPRAQELESSGDNTPLSDEIDAILVTEENEMRTDRLGKLLDRAAALAEAFHRIDDGTYGLCVACGNRLSSKRLAAVPEALRCTDCQEEIEKASPHELHAHEWKWAEEADRELRKSENADRVVSEVVSASGRAIGV
ncbi:MAG TPA: TraR/DksA C4-type zinc finger protein [Vicinamibacteria bacterium]|nr:TraR/DksA C4-type zinc finger protein [Vicinamibacteria bacterium]